MDGALVIDATGVQGVSGLMTRAHEMTMNIHAARPSRLMGFGRVAGHFLLATYGISTQLCSCPLFQSEDEPIQDRTDL